MSLAWRNLLRDRTRLSLSVTGVALAVMLILILNGFVSGMNQQVSAYLDHTPGSIVLVQAGTRGASSTLPSTAAEAARRVDGVATAVPVIVQWAVLDLGKTKQYVEVVGYDSGQGGGPWSLRAGRAPAADDELVLDSQLADQRGIGVGDTFVLMGQTFRVVGLSLGTRTWMASYLFIRLPVAQRLFGVPGTASMVLITPAAGVTTGDLLSRLGGTTGVDSELKSQLIADQRSTYTAVFAGPIQLMAGIASLVGALVVGMIVYAATIERRREYGVLKALGARNRVLYQVVGTQALAAGLAGALLGLTLGSGAAALIMALRPQFLITVELQSGLLALVAGVGMALLGALLPARLLARVAPAEALRR